MRSTSIPVLSWSILAFAIACNATTAADAQGVTGVNVRAQQTWTVSEAPAGAWDVYLTRERLEPGFWTGAHTHPGPEYGLIVDGEVRVWEHGTQRGVKAGEDYFIATDAVHEAGNTSAGRLRWSRRICFRATASFTA